MQLVVLASRETPSRIAALRQWSSGSVDAPAAGAVARMNVSNAAAIAAASSGEALGAITRSGEWSAGIATL
ncbi:MAG TPA: hypothetical protein VNR42_09860 [Solirubrobacteraceae bacterium]|nr:hypothetical protein [Solirubrobacteraceae bacterium]